MAEVCRQFSKWEWTPGQPAQTWGLAKIKARSREPGRSFGLIDVGWTVSPKRSAQVLTPGARERDPFWKEGLCRCSCIKGLAMWSSWTSGPEVL